MNDMTSGALIEKAGACRLEFVVDDPLIVPELLAYPVGVERDKYALTALRIGVLALKQAQGRLDADMIRSEGERLLETLGQAMRAHVGDSDSALAKTLAAHFGEQ